MNLFEVIASCVILLVFSYSLVPCVLKGASLAERIRERKEILLEKKFFMILFLLPAEVENRKLKNGSPARHRFLKKHRLKRLRKTAGLFFTG